MRYDMAECGQRIKAARLKNDITQEQMAEHLNLSWSMISKIERGTNSPSIETLVEIADFLNVSVDFLTTGKDWCDGKHCPKCKQCKKTVFQAISVLQTMDFQQDL